MSGSPAAGIGAEVLPPSVLPGDEELALREVVRDLLGREAPPTAAEFAAGDRRERLWATAAELGWPALAVPEECEGLGLDFLTQAGLLEEAGKGPFPGPLTTAAAAAAVLVAAPSGDARDGALAAIAGGAVASLAVIGDEAGEDLAGAAAAVPDADLARSFVLLGGSGLAAEAFLLAAEDIAVEPFGARVDAGRPLFALRFDPAAATSLGPAPGGLAVARALLAAELVGVAERSLEVAIEHVRDRRQFGRPIGSFQAVKHLLADVYVAIERARSLTRGALAGDPFGRPPAELDRDAAMAKAAASEAAQAAVRTAIQLTGALGTTAEHPLPWLLGRARVGAQQLGGAPALYAQVGREAARR
jgi:alkylation response protein AidB-like acyl-CoA dehydrogenase